jgi:hypothetical protein
VTWQLPEDEAVMEKALAKSPKDVSPCRWPLTIDQLL